MAEQDSQQLLARIADALDDRKEALTMAVHVQALGDRLEDFRAALEKRLDRLEAKVDANMEDGFEHDAKVEQRFVKVTDDHELRLKAVELAVGADATVGQRRLTTWQITGIVVGIAVGLAGLFLTVLTIVVAVLVAVFA